MKFKIYYLRQFRDFYLINFTCFKVCVCLSVLTYTYAGVPMEVQKTTLRMVVSSHHMRPGVGFRFSGVATHAFTTILS